VKKKSDVLCGVPVVCVVCAGTYVAVSAVFLFSCGRNPREFSPVSSLFSYFRYNFFPTFSKSFCRSNPKSQVRSPKSEVRSPKSEVRSPKSEVRSPKSEVRSPKSEVRSPKSPFPVGVLCTVSVGFSLVISN
jgi:hypothetical protein